MFGHINANKEDISNLVLICGDPLRVKAIAKKYLNNYKEVCNTRNMLGYTGYYKGVRVSIMSHGMGIPSAGIYTYELFNNYDVDYMIRLGTAGSFVKDIKVRDIVLTKESFSTSNYAYEYNKDTSKIMKSNEELDNIIKEEASNKGINLIESRTFTSDCFYGETNNIDLIRDKFNCTTVEMESFVIFYNAKLFNKKASCLLTIVDSYAGDNTVLSDEEKESGLNDMIKLALDSIIKVGN